MKERMVEKEKAEGVDGESIATNERKSESKDGKEGESVCMHACACACVCVCMCLPTRRNGSSRQL